jgi:O-antigen/teichoic acid export membrane protein
MATLEEVQTPAQPLPEGGQARSRSARIAAALTIGYGFQAVVAATGLVLTPILLARLGTETYGQWLVIGQVLAMLALLDLGVAAILPREVALSCGRGGSDGVASVTHRAVWLVWLQTPVVGLVAAGVWTGVSAGEPQLGGPLAVILAVVVVQFPLRIPGAVLVGLQDQAFGSLASAAGWLLTTVLSVGLVFAGFSLYALAAGWAAGQLLTCALCWGRLRSRHPGVTLWGAWPGGAALGRHLRPSLWTAARQLAQLLVYGSDLVILGGLLGPAVVVVYSCSTRLLTLLNNQAYLLATTAVPALSELSVGGDRDRLCRASQALGLAMLIVSGGLGIVVLTTNAAFTQWWVGPELFAGALLTLLTVVSMVARHWVFTWLQTVFAFGHDRRLALAALADGAVTLVATIAWTSAFGVLGVPLGSLTGLVLTNGPVGLATLSAAMGAPPLRILAWTWPWLWRFVAVAGTVAAITCHTAASRPAVAAGLLLGGLTGYGLAVRTLLVREPLRPYSLRLLASLRRRLCRHATGCPLKGTPEC